MTRLRCIVILVLTVAVAQVPLLAAGGATASAAGGAAVRTDTTPPTLAAFAVSPLVIDTERVPQRIAFTAHIKDDSSGVKAAGAGAVSHVQFRSPGRHFVLARFDAAHRISGTPTDGEYRDLVTLPAGSDSGTWSVWQFRLVDEAGNAATVDAQQLAAKGFPSSFANTPGTGRSLAVTRAGLGSGTVRSIPVGIACPSVCGTEFASGTVTLYEAPSPTSLFKGWHGACSGTGTRCSVTMDHHRWVQATFAPNLQTLTVTASGPGVVTSSPPGSTARRPARPGS